jgi:hypothetical protein
MNTTTFLLFAFMGFALATLYVSMSSSWHRERLQADLDDLKRQIADLGAEGTANDLIIEFMRDEIAKIKARCNPPGLDLADAKPCGFVASWEQPNALLRKADFPEIPPFASTGALPEGGDA